MGRQPKKTSEFDARLGAVVRSKRIKRDLSQADAAAGAGIPLSNYQRREAGTNEITVSELNRIAEVVGVPAHALVQEALDDFGGMQKLIDEHVGMSEAPVSLDAHRRNRTPAEMTEEEMEGVPNAAGTDPELGYDEPEQP